MTNEHGLTDQQEAFARLYVGCGNAKQAAIGAGYSEDSAQEQGSRLLSIAKVRAFVDKLKIERNEALNFKAIDLLWKLQEVIDFDPVDFFDDAGNIRPLNEIPIELRRLITGVKQTKFGPEYVIMSREKAIEMLARHHSLFNDKSEITIKDETKTPEETRERIAALQKKLADSKAAEGGA